MGGDIAIIAGSCRGTGTEIKPFAGPTVTKTVQKPFFPESVLAASEVENVPLRVLGSVVTEARVNQSIAGFRVSPGGERIAKPATPRSAQYWCAGIIKRGVTIIFAYRA